MVEDRQEQVLKFPGYSAEEITADDLQLRPDDLARHKRMSLPFFFIWISLMAFGFIMMFSASFGESFVASSRNVNVVEDEALLEKLPEVMQTEVIAVLPRP